MAELIREQDTLTLKLTTAEKFEGLHTDLHVPMTSVESTHIEEDIIHAIHAFRAIGTSVPGYAAMGSFVAAEGAIFVMVHRQHKRGVRINLSNAPYVAWVVGLDDPEGVRRSLGL